MAEKLTANEIREHLRTLDGWERSGNAIRKQYVFESFMAAIRFVNRAAERAEAADHHPDIAIHYRKVTMTLTTHSAGGLTRKDFALARKIEGVVNR